MTRQNNQQAIAFCADVAHAGTLALCFEAEGVPAAVIHGAMDAGDRRAALARFREGESKEGFECRWFVVTAPSSTSSSTSSSSSSSSTAQLSSHQHEIIRNKLGGLRVLTNYGVLTEGFDAPGCDTVLMARPTLSRGLYLQVGPSFNHLHSRIKRLRRPVLLIPPPPPSPNTQMLGRAARPDVALPTDSTAAQRRARIAASAKPHMRVIDVVDNLTKHAEAAAPVTLPSLLALPPAFDMRGASLDGVLRELQVQVD